ncbi:MAG: Ig-like domain-containing protein, partial [bacterium]|nr:Ig-like domain-containing protein [bacterium]
TYLPPHDILHYVNKDDPQGPTPMTPSDDPQYQNWENALQDWVTRMNKKSDVIVLEEPPTELDPVQSFELMPKIVFISPYSGQIITNRDMILEVQATAPRGVVKVVFQVDNNLVGYANSFPFKTTYTARSLTNTKHILKAVAQDDLGNMGEAIIEFEMNATEEPASFDWGESKTITVQKDSFPRKLYLLPFRWDAAEKLDVYLTTDGNKKLIYTFKSSEDKPTDSGLSFSWKHYPGAGEYTMTGELVDKSGNIMTKDLMIEVK